MIVRFKLFIRKKIDLFRVNLVPGSFVSFLIFLFFTKYETFT